MRKPAGVAGRGGESGGWSDAGPEGVHMRLQKGRD